MTWQPTCITRFVEARKSSTQVVIVETDVGRGYLKAMGNPEGDHALACDLVGTQLASWLGLRTLDHAIVELDDLVEIKFFNGQLAQPGPALITRAVAGDSWSGDLRQLASLLNPDDISKLVVLDTWIRNRDRHSTARLNRDNVFLSSESKGLELLAIDHTHCFGMTGGRLTERVADIGNIKDSAVYGLFPEFRGYMHKTVVAQCAECLGTIDKNTIKEFVAALPGAWQVPAKVQSALVQLIERRAHYVAETIVERLWPQKELEFTEGPEEQ